jgi:signal transduction histidine kinase
VANRVAEEGENDVRRAYLEYSRDGLRRAAAPALVLLAVFGIASGSVELWHFPARLVPLLLLNAAYLGCGLGHLLLVRRWPEWTVPSSIAGAIFVHLAVVAYFTGVGGSAELCLLIVAALMTGQVILHPWNAWTQLTASAVPLVAYLLGLRFGMESHLPAIYPAFALLTMVMLTAVGAWRLDRHRYEAFRQARNLERVATEQRHERAFVEGLLDLARAMSATIGDPRRLAQELAERTRRSVGVDWVLVHRWVESSSSYVLAAAAGVPADLVGELEAVGRSNEWMGPIASVLRNDGTFEVLQSDVQSPLPRALLQRWKIGAVRVQRVARDNRNGGFLTCVILAEPRPFTPEQRRMLEATATQAAVALENAGLVEASRAAEQVKSEFVATVSHELRTPLNVILGYTDLILDNAFGVCAGPEREALERVRHQSLQLLDLIQGILDLNRLEVRGTSLHLQRFSVEELLERLREGLPENWMRADVALRWDGKASGTVVRTDRAKLEILLRNLIHNALKFTPKGEVVIGANVARSGGIVQFQVRDTGCGIAAEDLPRVFEMFGQAPGAERAGGFGLGLYIVKRLSDALGGSLEVESTPGRGSCFTFNLPLGTG